MHHSWENLGILSPLAIVRLDIVLHGFLSPLDFVPLGFCPPWILSHLDIVPLGFCPHWILSPWVFVLLGFWPLGYCPMGFCPVGFCPRTLQGPAAHRLQWPWEQRLTILTTTSRPTFRPDHPSSHTSSTRLFQRLGCLAEPGPGEPGN